MRLINCKNFQLKEFMGDDNLPPYAILSHTWGEDEVSYQEMRDLGLAALERKAGFLKIRYCCIQALTDHLKWAWVDTCCIDKSSSAELSEAINSMFRWYKKSNICYAYIADVSFFRDDNLNEPDFRKSRWFTRGWTLQELVAPTQLMFYSNNWTKMGSKQRLRQLIRDITKIDVGILEGGALTSASIAARMSWASERTTTRPEDMAYSLLGIFDVNMPLLYGEGGEKAFLRLQEEILRNDYDDSIFAWTDYSVQDHSQDVSEIAEDILDSFDDIPRSTRENLRGLLAKSPQEFRRCHRVDVLEFWPVPGGGDTTIQNRCININLPLLKRHEENLYTAVLGCRSRFNRDKYIGIVLKQWGSGGEYYGRQRRLVTVSASHIHLQTEKSIRECTVRVKVKEETALNKSIGKCFILKSIPPYKSGYSFAGAHCFAPTTFDRRLGVIRLGPSMRGFKSVLVFRHASQLSFAIGIPSIGNDLNLVYAKTFNNYDDITSTEIIHGPFRTRPLEFSYGDTVESFFEDRGWTGISRSGTVKLSYGKKLVIRLGDVIPQFLEKLFTGPYATLSIEIDDTEEKIPSTLEM